MELILLILILLGLFGFLKTPLFTYILFTLGERSITLNDVLIFLVILWLIDMLPYPFQQIAVVLYLLWILSSIGIIAISGFSNIVLIALVIGLIVYIATSTYSKFKAN